MAAARGTVAALPAAMQRGGFKAVEPSLREHALLDVGSMSMNDTSERRGIAGMPVGEVATVHLIPWGDGEQGVLFTYANGRKVAVPIDRDPSSPIGDRIAQALS